MPLFGTKEERAAKHDARDDDDRARGVKVVVEESDRVPAVVEDHCGRGWELDTITYAGPGSPIGGPRAHALQTVVFRWPRDEE